MMLFTGMCFKNNEADSSLICSSSENTHAVLSLKDTALSHQNACTDESISSSTLLTLRNLAEAKHTNEHLHFKINTLFSSLESLPKNFKSLFRKASAGNISKTFTSNVVITDYIHNQDGEKA